MQILLKIFVWAVEQDLYHAPQIKLIKILVRRIFLSPFIPCQPLWSSPQPFPCRVFHFSEFPHKPEYFPQPEGSSATTYTKTKGLSISPSVELVFSPFLIILSRTIQLGLSYLDLVCSHLHLIFFFKYVRTFILKMMILFGLRKQKHPPIISIHFLRLLRLRSINNFFFLIPSISLKVCHPPRHSSPKSKGQL